MYAKHIKPKFRRTRWNNLPDWVRSDFQIANLLRNTKPFRKNGFQVYVCQDFLFIISRQDEWYVAQFQTNS